MSGWLVGNADINERWLDTSTTIGLEVMGDDGVRIGRLVDASFDQDSLEIDAYLLRDGFWSRLYELLGQFGQFGHPARIQPDKVHACSRELMLVTTGHVKASDIVPEETAPLDLRMPLKNEDRLPDYEPERDGTPVTAARR